MKEGDWSSHTYTTTEIGQNDVSITGAGQITTSGKRLASRPAGSTGCGSPVHFNRSLYKTAFRGAANPTGTAPQTVQIAFTQALTLGSTDYLICDKTKEHGLCNACTATLVSPLTHPILALPRPPSILSRPATEKMPENRLPKRLSNRRSSEMGGKGLRRKTRTAVRTGHIPKSLL
jgi:hypothetical protein